MEGKFNIELSDQDREMAANFGFIEMVERTVIKKPIVQLLTEATEGKFSVMDMVDAFYCGLKANRDTRMSRAEIGNEIMQKGSMNYLVAYIELLTYALTGNAKPESTDDPDKKK